MQVSIKSLCSCKLFMQSPCLLESNAHDGLHKSACIIREPGKHLETNSPANIDMLCTFVLVLAIYKNFLYNMCFIFLVGGGRKKERERETNLSLTIISEIDDIMTQKKKQKVLQLGSSFGTQNKSLRQIWNARTIVLPDLVGDAEVREELDGDFVHAWSHWFALWCNQSICSKSISLPMPSETHKQALASKKWNRLQSKVLRRGLTVFFRALPTKTGEKWRENT